MADGGIQDALARNSQNSAKNSAKAKRGNPDKIKPFQFQPGHSGNPGGRPKRDVASEIAQAIFEGNQDLIRAAMLKTLKKGDSRVFAALADRAYGKPIQAVKLDGTLNVTADERRARVGEIVARIAGADNR